MEARVVDRSQIEAMSNIVLFFAGMRAQFILANHKNHTKYELRQAMIFLMPKEKQ